LTGAAVTSPFRAAHLSCKEELERPSARPYRGGATNRRDCLSYAFASASTRASWPGSPTIDTLSAGIPSAPKPPGTETSGRPSQLPYASAVGIFGHGSTARGALNGMV